MSAEHKLRPVWTHFHVYQLIIITPISLTLRIARNTNTGSIDVLHEATSSYHAHMSPNSYLLNAHISCYSSTIEDCIIERLTWCFIVSQTLIMYTEIPYRTDQRHPIFRTSDDILDTSQFRARYIQAV